MILNFSKYACLVDVKELSKSTSAVSKSAMCEFRSATAGAINGSRSLQDGKQDLAVKEAMSRGLQKIIFNGSKPENNNLLR